MRNLLFCVVLLVTAANSPADVIIGPGDVAVTNGDGAFDIVAVDLISPATLGPGTYAASTFNYQFTDFSGFQTTGTNTPVLLTGGGTIFTPVAVGDTFTFAGPTGFVSAPFGGIDTFTLAASTTVYGGIYWEATNSGGPELRMPVGFQNNVGSVFVVFGGGFGPGADPPMVGTSLSGSAQGFFQRTYDFSIEVAAVPVQVVAVPEPSTLLIALVGGASIIGGGMLHRGRAGSAVGRRPRRGRAANTL